MILLLTIISINPDTFYMGGLKDNFALQVEGGGGCCRGLFSFFLCKFDKFEFGNL